MTGRHRLGVNELFLTPTEGGDKHQDIFFPLFSPSGTEDIFVRELGDSASPAHCCTCRVERMVRCSMCGCNKVACVDKNSSSA